MTLEDKCNNELERMMYLMEYKTSVPKQNSGIEYHTVAADGNAYGIIKEGDTYYLKKTTADKELVKESYDYLNGFNYRNEYGYKSYDKATKHLELELMAINERYNKHEDVSVVDFNKGEKDLSILTEEARREMNRVNQIFENAEKIGMRNIGDPESKGKAEDPTKQGDPFEINTTAKLDKDLKVTGTVEKATPKESDCKDCDYEDAKSDIEGVNVAEQKPKGAKAVKMNENTINDEEDFDEDDFTEEDFVDDPNDVEQFNQVDLDGEIEEPIEYDFETEDPNDNVNNETDELVGFDSDEDGLNETIDRIASQVVESLKPVKECGKKKKSLDDVIYEMVCEEINRINDWGKHPRFQKPTFDIDNDEVEIVNRNGERSWDDTSVKTKEPYGKKIGKGDPYTKMVELLTDTVIKSLKESIRLKKK